MDSQHEESAPTDQASRPSTKSLMKQIDDLEQRMVDTRSLLEEITAERDTYKKKVCVFTISNIHGITRMLAFIGRGHIFSLYDSDITRFFFIHTCHCLWIVIAQHLSLWTYLDG